MDPRLPRKSFGFLNLILAFIFISAFFIACSSARADDLPPPKDKEVLNVPSDWSRIAEEAEKEMRDSLIELQGPVAPTTAPLESGKHAQEVLESFRHEAAPAAGMDAALDNLNRARLNQRVDFDRLDQDIQRQAQTEEDIRALLEPPLRRALKLRPQEMSTQGIRDYFQLLEAEDRILVETRGEPSAEEQKELEEIQKSIRFNQRLLVNRLSSEIQEKFVELDRKRMSVLSEEQTLIHSMTRFATLAEMLSQRLNPLSLGEERQGALQSLQTSPAVESGRRTAPQTPETGKWRIQHKEKLEAQVP